MNTNTRQEGTLSEEGTRDKEEEKEMPREEKEGTIKGKGETELPSIRIFGKASGIKFNKGHIPPKPPITTEKRDIVEEETQQEEEEWEEYWISSQPELFTKPKSRAPPKKISVTYLVEI